MSLQESLAKLEGIIKLTTPLLKEKSPFTPELLNQLNLGVYATASACSDWFSDLLSHSDAIVSSVEHVWTQALSKKESSDLEKFTSLKETGDLLLSMQKTFEELKEALPSLKQKVKNCLAKVAKGKEPATKEMQNQLNLLLQEMEKIGKALPSKLKKLEKLIQEKDIQNSIEKFSKKAEKSLEKETTQKLMKNFNALTTPKEERLDAYLKLKRQLNAALSLPHAAKSFLKKYRHFARRRKNVFVKKPERNYHFMS